jgi:hypothetical protein
VLNRGDCCSSAAAPLLLVLLNRDAVPQEGVMAVTAHGNHFEYLILG